MHVVRGASLAQRLYRSAALVEFVWRRGRKKNFSRVIKSRWRRAAAKHFLHASEGAHGQKVMDVS